MDQFEKEFNLEATKRADNPVFKVFFPAIVNVRRPRNGWTCAEPCCRPRLPYAWTGPMP